MHIITNILSLEVTQMCNLDCKHCLQGKSCAVFMKDEVIYNTFKEIKVVKTLVLTGGEVFLAYNTIKRVFEIAKELNTKILSCEIVTNSCIYDQRIYDLLDAYFGNNYSIFISMDDFHDKSIERIYKDKKIPSKNPELNPNTLEEVVRNMEKHLNNPHFASFKTLGNKLINVGRAKEITNSMKYEYCVVGYFYNFYKQTLLVGPVIFVDANGYIGDGDSEIELREKESLGNVCQESIANCVLNGGIKENFTNLSEFYYFCDKRLKNYYLLADNQKYYRIENKKMKEIEIIKDTSYKEELKQFTKFLSSVNSSEDLFQKIWNYDFSQYPYDLSVVDHNR